MIIICKTLFFTRFANRETTTPSSPLVSGSGTSNGTVFTTSGQRGILSPSTPQRTPPPPVSVSARKRHAAFYE